MAPAALFLATRRDQRLPMIPLAISLAAIGDDR